MICECLTRNAVRELEVGQVGLWTLPHLRAVESAIVTISRMKRVEGMDFERIETGEPLTIAYRRIK